jgi:hypothetical protein
MSFEDIKERIPKNLEWADKWRSPEETWEQKEVLSPCGHAGMEAQCLKKAMETILWVAVREHDSWASAQSVFDKYDVEKLLERYADAMVKAFEEVLPKDTKHPWFVNNDIIHSAVLLGRFDLVKRLYGRLQRVGSRFVLTASRSML